MINLSNDPRTSQKFGRWAFIALMIAMLVFVLYASFGGPEVAVVRNGNDGVEAHEDIDAVITSDDPTDPSSVRERDN